MTNRQSMAIVTATRIQDDFSSNALTSFALARPAGRSSGLRTDDPIFRIDLRRRFPRTQKRAGSVYGRDVVLIVGQIT